MLAGIAVFLLPRVTPGLFILACQKSKCIQKFLFCRLFRLSIRNQDRQTRRPANWESRWETARQNTPLCRRLKYYVPPCGVVPDYPPVRGGLCQLSLGSNRRRSVVAVEGTAGIEPAHPSCACRGCSVAMPILAPLPYCRQGCYLIFRGDRNRTGLLMQEVSRLQLSYRQCTNRPQDPS